MEIRNEMPPAVDAGTLIAMDMEMFGQEKGKLHRPTGKFACLSICFDPTVVYQIYDETQIKQVIRQLRHGVWVFHNSLYDLRQMQRFCPSRIPDIFIWDTMLVDQSMFGGMYREFGLDDLVRRWLKERMDKEVRQRFDDADVMTDQMKRYAAKDAQKTLQIAALQKTEFGDEPAFQAYVNVDEPMIRPILDMPGALVDAERWAKLVKIFQARADEIEDELGINSFSGKQVMTEASKHKVNIRDTKAMTLKEYSTNPFIAKVIEARKFRKAVSTYGMSWLENNVEEDGKVYSSYHITGAETGRMSSSNPNMQQIPARVLPEYRTLFPSGRGEVLLVSDVNQQEPRILAYESRDEELMRIFEEGGDSHLEVARTIFHDPKMKKEDPRRKNEGKTINLGLSYGLSEYGLAVRLGISEQEAAGYIRTYFTRFKGVLSWINMQRNKVANSGFATTTSGRRVYMNMYDRGWQNKAINAPIQGGAADFTKVWVRKIWERCRSKQLPFAVSIIVHDEIVQSVPVKEERTYTKIMNEAFHETAKELFSPIPFEFETIRGRSWACKQISGEEYDDEAE